MKKLMFLLVPVFLIACASESSNTEEAALSSPPEDIYTPVIEDIAKAPVTPPVEPPVPPVEPPVEPPVPPVEPPVPPVEPPEKPPVTPPTVLPPHRGEYVRELCRQTMSEEVKMISQEVVFHEHRTDTIAIRWKFTDKDWIIFIVDETRKGPPRCRKWTNDGDGKPLEM